MKQLQSAALIGLAAIGGLILLAALVRPLLPYLFALFVIGCVIRMAIRN